MSQPNLNIRVCTVSSCDQSWLCRGTEGTCSKIRRGNTNYSSCFCLDCLIEKKVTIKEMLRLRHQFLIYCENSSDLQVCYPVLKVKPELLRGRKG